MENLSQLLAQFLLLTGFAALVAPVIDVLKIFNIVKENSAPFWSVGINLLGFVIFSVISLWKPEFNWLFVDQTLANIAAILVSVLTLIGQFIITPKVHNGLKDTPLSWSHTK